ncbi:hypothetical protein, partial [Kitasatospora phosalacinea]|uniref:hypothetical protein n=1 Tax=Kitasatospora phosalacinea TaxID=2065 RepID=UPI0005246D0E
MPVRTTRPHRRLDLTALYDLHHHNYLRYAELLLHTVLNLPLDVAADLTGAEAATTHVHLRALTARADRPKPRRSGRTGPTGPQRTCLAPASAWSPPSPPRPCPLL